MLYIPKFSPNLSSLLCFFQLNQLLLPKMELVNGALQVAEEDSLFVTVHSQDVLSEPVEMTNVVIKQMLQLRLIWYTFDEVNQDAIHLLDE